MDTDKSDNIAMPTLPRGASLPINRCNLPAQILGSLTFQSHPSWLSIDGVNTLYRDLFQQLDAISQWQERASHFCDYMTVMFRLNALEDAGYSQQQRFDRAKADYLRALRGWGFDSESRDGAVLKGWVESRFGLLCRFHHGPLRSADSDGYRTFQHTFAAGIYNTNALLNQLDLLYSYCQYEIQRAQPDRKHLTLYRGINNLDDFEQLPVAGGETVVLLNNINSFSANSERAGEFGDHILQVEVPLAKLAFYHGLLPSGVFKGEEEYAVISGLYRVKFVDW